MSRAAAVTRPVRSPMAEHARGTGSGDPAVDPLHHSPRMAAQRRQLARAFGPQAVAQLGKEDNTGPGGGERALVEHQNLDRNMQLLEQVFARLPKRTREYLLWLRSQLPTGEDGDSGSRALVKGPRRSPVLSQVLGMDPALFATVLLGLKAMPETQVLPRTLAGVRQLFLSLATARSSLSSSVPLLEGGELAPVESGYGERRGVEHVQSSCYAASILNLVAAVPAYRRLFDSRLTPTPPDSEPRLLQQTIGPMLRTLGSNGTVRAADVRRLLQVLGQLGLLQGGEDALEQQQDASQVMMAILQRVQPWQDQVLTAHAVRYDNPGGENRNALRLQRQAVLQLTAVGHRTLEQALIAYFGVERRAGRGIANPHRVSTRAVSFPPVLSIGMLRQGSGDHIDMPQVFRIPGAVTAGGQPGPRYRLQAFIVRTTFSHESDGHYVAVMRDGPDGWAESDDMGESKEDEPGVMSPRTRSIDVSTHAVDGHPAPAYALATLYTYVLDEDQDADAPDRVSFPGSMRLGEDAIARSIFDSVAPGDVGERERLTREFLSAGGTEWEAIDIMRRARTNSQLAAAYELCLMEDRGKSSRGKRKDVSGNKYYEAFKDMPTGSLLLLARDLPEKIRKGSESAPDQLEAVTALLRERQEAQRGEDYGLLFSDRNEAGTRLEIHGTKNITKAKGRLGAWMDGVSRALLGSTFIASRRPPLVIRIRLRPTVTSDIASTYSVGNRITINLDDYQVTEFSIGQTIGLLAHEIGVHSLDDTTLTREELAAEEKDKDSRQTGRHGGETFTIVADKTLKKQQDDHLTIGRGLLGQLSALPRLNMYESTLISLLEALPPGRDRWEAAAAYCIDIARILVNNDDPTAMMADKFSQLAGAHKIARTAANEWMRMCAKHPKNKVVTSIDIGYLDIFKALFTLATLLDKVAKEAKKK